MFYGDLYRPVDGIVKSGYISGQNLKVGTRVSPALAITTEGSKKEGVDGAFSWDSSTQCYGKNLKTNGSLGLDGAVSTQAKIINGDLVYGGSAVLATEPSSSNNKVKSFVQYAQKGYTFEATVEKKVGAPVTVDTSATFNYEGLTLGAKALLTAYPTPKNQADILNNYHLGLRYSDKNYTFAALAEDKLQRLKIGFAQKIDDKLSVALDVNQTLAGTKLSKPTFTLGNTYQIDANSAVRAKINNNGEVAAAYKVNINNRLTATTTVQTNVFDSTKGAKTGVLFEFSA